MPPANLILLSDWNLSVKYSIDLFQTLSLQVTKTLKKALYLAIKITLQVSKTIKQINQNILKISVNKLTTIVRNRIRCILAPHGISPPVVYPLSPSTLRVSWLPPIQPNGQIVAYNVIIDDITIHTNLTEASAYVINDLRPYTVYAIKVLAASYMLAEWLYSVKVFVSFSNLTHRNAFSFNDIR